MRTPARVRLMRPTIPGSPGQLMPAAAIGAPPDSRVRRQAVLKACAFMAAAAILSASQNACARYVSAEVHPFEIAFFRAVFGLTIFVPLFVRHGLQPLRTQRLPLHLIRGGIQSAAMLLFFSGIALTPLATAAALQFTTPLFAAVMATLILRETIRARRLTALAVGFLGALVILRPGAVPVQAGSLLILGSAAAWASSMTLIKILSRTESSATITIYVSLIMAPVALVPTLFVWQMPNLVQLGWLAAIGVFASSQNLCVALAFRDTEMTVLMPLDFSKLVWSALLGYVFLAEVPEIWTWVGGVIIFSAAMYVAYRESRVRSAAAPSGATPPMA